MKTSISRRTLCQGMAATFALPAAFAQTWPRQALRVIVAGPPGSAPDAMMRVIGDKLAAELGKPVVIDNRPGAGGIIAVQSLQSARDAHTLIFMMTSVGVVTPLLFKAAKFDAARDFVPVAGLAETSFMLVAARTAPTQDLAELIRLATQRPDTIVVAHAGIGTLTHLAVEGLASQSKAKFRIVGFNGPGPALSALVNGDAQYYVDALAAVQPMLESGRVTPVAIFTAASLPGWESYHKASDVVKGVDYVGSFGLMATSDLPAEGARAIAAAAEKLLKDPDVVARLRGFGTYPHFLDGPGYAAALKKERDQWGQVVKSANIEIQ